MRNIVNIFVIMLLFSSPCFSIEKCIEDFDKHIEIISGDRKLQENSITYPLDYRFVDKENDEMPIVNKHLSKSEVENRKEPIFLLLSDQKKYGVERRKKIISNDEIEFALTLPESDGLVLIYKFRSEEGCWKLFSFSDYSL